MRPPTVIPRFQAEDTKCSPGPPLRKTRSSMSESSTEAQLREQIEQLRTHLQTQIEHLQAQIDSLLLEHGRHPHLAQTDAESESTSGFPPGSNYLRPQFQQERDRRTEARSKLICASNAAGNALCAWHDSRRERRAYPPRMAPVGMLNCGCSEEEALFEESLARNGVGSYRPSGDQVRIDPVLRRPLLALLKERYGYRDGDFEIDRRTGTWKEGEDYREWENRLSVRTSRRQ